MLHRNVKILNVYEGRLQTSKNNQCGLIEIGRIRQPLDQKFFKASTQPPGLLESFMLDVLMSTCDSVLSSFATSLYSFQSECITTSWPSSVRACLWNLNICFNTWNSSFFPCDALLFVVIRGSGTFGNLVNIKHTFRLFLHSFLFIGGLKQLDTCRHLPKYTILKCQAWYKHEPWLPKTKQKMDIGTQASR